MRGGDDGDVGDLMSSGTLRQPAPLRDCRSTDADVDAVPLVVCVRRGGRRLPACDVVMEGDFPAPGSVAAGGAIDSVESRRSDSCCPPVGSNVGAHDSKQHRSTEQSVRTNDGDRRVSECETRPGRSPTRMTFDTVASVTALRAESWPRMTPFAPQNAGPRAGKRAT